VRYGVGVWAGVGGWVATSLHYRQHFARHALYLTAAPPAVAPPQALKNLCRRFPERQASEVRAALGRAVRRPRLAEPNRSRLYWSASEHAGSGGISELTLYCISFSMLH
jgi:hypothetical protein